MTIPAKGIKRIMKKIISVITVLSLICALLSSCVSQDNPTSTAEEKEDISIAVTSAAICEILDKLDYDNVVGIPETENEIPERYENATEIGAPMSPDLEIISSLSPDLILSPISLEGSLSEQYSTAEVDAEFLDLSSVEGMYEAITYLGELLDRKEQAEALVADYNQYLEGYKQEEGEAPSVLLLMAFPDGFYLVATEKSYVGNLVELAGGENVYSNYDGDEYGFVNINPEDMIQRDADMILVFAHYSEEAAFAYMEEELASNETWQYYDAVSEENVYYLPSSYFGMSATLTSWTDALDYLNPIFYGG